MASHFPVYWCPVPLRRNSQFDLSVYQLAIILTFYQMSQCFVVLNVRETKNKSNLSMFPMKVGREYAEVLCIRRMVLFKKKLSFDLQIHIFNSHFCITVQVLFCCCVLVMTLSVIPNSSKNHSLSTEEIGKWNKNSFETITLLSKNSVSS